MKQTVNPVHLLYTVITIGYTNSYCVGPVWFDILLDNLVPMKM